MIIRKPYAFLIKNFKKIHIFLLILGLFVAYSLFGVNKFVSDFMKFGVYDYFNDPVTNHITGFLSFCLIILFFGSLALVFLLKHKNKPWKLYLIPVVEYLVLLLVLLMIKGFFDSYSEEIVVQDLRLSRDLLFIFILLQIPTLGIFIVRILGLDFKKFNFNSDEEYLELSEEDREEIEIGLNIDKNSFIRFFKKLKRNLNYFYLEHKRICKFILIIIILVSGYKMYGVFNAHRSYKEGSSYTINGYTITINNSYYTDKDYRGEVISEKSNFIVLDITVTNHGEPRSFKSEYLHIKSGTKNYNTTRKTYSRDFKDLGDAYDNILELKRNQSIRFIEVYRVDKELRKNSFVLFYQENDGNLRKVKLKLKDLREIEDMGVINLGDDATFNVKNVEETISFDSYEISNSGKYTTNTCITTGCRLDFLDYNYTNGKSVLKISFASTTFEGKDMVDFSKDYGKIVYIDNDNIEESIDFKYPFSKTAKGKYIYTLVPEEIKDSSLIKIVYTVRNKEYTYTLKEGEQK